MLPARGLHRTKDGSHHGAADAHEGDHDDEPADADCLADHHPAAGLGVLSQSLGLVTLAPGSTFGIGIRIPGSETEKNVE